MKKAFALMMAIIMAAAMFGCSSSKVSTVESDEFSIVKRIHADVQNPFDTVKHSYLSYIHATPKEIYNAINTKAEERDQIGDFPNDAASLEFELNKDTNDIFYIKLSTETETTEQAEARGLLISLVTEVFCPGYGEAILKELGVFTPSSDRKIYHTVQCGNVQFSYNNNRVFKIEAIKIQEEQKPNLGVVKP